MRACEYLDDGEGVRFERQRGACREGPPDDLGNNRKFKIRTTLIIKSDQRNLVRGGESHMNKTSLFAGAVGGLLVAGVAFGSPYQGRLPLIKCTNKYPMASISSLRL